MKQLRLSAVREALGPLLPAAAVGVFVFLAPIVAAATDDWDLRAIQTLVDSEAGHKSTGAIAIQPSQVRAHLTHDTFQVRILAHRVSAEHNPPRGQYRLAYGAQSFPPLSPRLYRSMSEKDPVTGATLSARRVMEDQKPGIEVIARKQEQALSYELRFIFNPGEAWRPIVQERFQLLSTNAAVNRLQERRITQPPTGPPPTGPPPTEQKTSKHKATQQVTRPPQTEDFIGTWSGTMRNSRGESAADSTLIIKKGADGALQGVWHAGWHFKEAKLEGRVLTWQHRNIAADCRDYDNRLEINPDLKSAVLRYRAWDRCRAPGEYTGIAQLSKINNLPKVLFPVGVVWHGN